MPKAHEEHPALAELITAAVTISTAHAGGDLCDAACAFLLAQFKGSTPEDKKPEEKHEAKKH